MARSRIAVCLMLLAISLGSAVGQEADCSAYAAERDSLSQTVEYYKQEYATLSTRTTTAEAQATANLQSATQLQQTVTELQTKVAQLEQASQQAASQLQAAQAQAQAVPGLTRERDDLKAKLAAVQGELQAAQVQVASLQEQTSLGAIVKKAAAASYAQAISLADGAQVVAKELSEGNTTRLQATANQVAENYRFVAGAANALLQRELDEHLPQVKAQLAKACALWEQHVSLPAAPYVAQAKATAAKVEGEIKVALTTHATKVPAVAEFLKDPVNLQLVTYSIFALPLTLIFVSLVIMCCRAPSSPSLPTSGGKKQKRKQKSPGRAGV